MTLKKCTVTQLDDRFSRVEWGQYAVSSAEASEIFGRHAYLNSPAIAEQGSTGAWEFHKYPAGRDTLDELLREWGLTRHDPQPETAEERLRRLAAWEYKDGEPLAGEGRDEVTFGDLRAILAELDRLRTQRPVDVEAVLAPLRKLLREAARCQEGYVACAKEHAAAGAYETAVVDMRQSKSWELVIANVRSAIAEAEKIGRGE